MKLIAFGKERGKSHQLCFKHEIVFSHLYDIMKGIGELRVW